MKIYVYQQLNKQLKRIKRRLYKLKEDLYGEYSKV